MQQLYLLRHAEAEPWSPLGNDFSRALSDNGKRHAQALSAWASDTLDPPDTILCSAAKRTRETLAPLLAKWPQLLSATEYVDSIYGASLNMLLTLAGDAFSYSHRLLLVGHNPGIEDLLTHLLPADAAPRVQPMATGMLVVTGFPAGFKSLPGNGRLQHMIRRKDLAI